MENYNYDKNNRFLLVRSFEKPARGLGLDEKSLTSCPTLERFLKTIAHLMSFVKIQLTQTGRIKCSILCPRLLLRCTYSVSHNVSTPVFHPDQWNIPRYIVADKHLTGPN